MKKIKGIINNKIIRSDPFFFEATSTDSGKARICIAVDSTGSMGSTIEAVKGKVMRMIEKLAR